MRRRYLDLNEPLGCTFSSLRNTRLCNQYHTQLHVVSAVGTHHPASFDSLALSIKGVSIHGLAWVVCVGSGIAQWCVTATNYAQV